LWTVHEFGEKKKREEEESMITGKSGREKKGESKNYGRMDVHLHCLVWKRDKRGFG